VVDLISDLPRQSEEGEGWCGRAGNVRIVLHNKIDMIGSTAVNSVRKLRSRSVRYRVVKKSIGIVFGCVLFLRYHARFDTRHGESSLSVL
jgi:hypothetical protein